jgi:hypothetical protein
MSTRRRVLLIALAAVVTLPLAGALYQTLSVRRESSQFPPPGRLVNGLVFVDAGNSAIEERVAAQINWIEVESVCLAKTAAQLGVLRLFDPLGLRKIPSDSAAQTISLLYRVEPMATLCGVARGFRTTTQELTAAPPLPSDIPLVALVHGLAAYGQTIERAWLSLQQRFAQRSRRGTWRIVPGSDHLIGNSQPHAVADAVLEMVAEVRRAL